MSVSSSHYWRGNKQWDLVERWILHWAKAKESNRPGDFFATLNIHTMVIQIHKMPIPLILSIQEYAELMHEFMTAVKQIYGEKVLIQVRLIFYQMKNVSWYSLGFSVCIFFPPLIVFVNLYSLKISPTIMLLTYSLITSKVGGKNISWPDILVSWSWRSMSSVVWGVGLKVLLYGSKIGGVRFREWGW